MKADLIEPSKDEFLAYEEVRRSGATNMFDVAAVCALSGGVLKRAHCFYIMDGNNYETLYEKFIGPMADRE